LRQLDVQRQFTTSAAWSADVRTLLQLFCAIRRLSRIAATGLLAGSLLAASPLAGGPALAGDHDHSHGGGHGHGGGDHGGGDHGGGDHGHGEGHGRWEGGPPPGYAPGPAFAPPGPAGYPRHAPPPGYGLRRGGQIPPEYRDAVVPDYGRHRLRPPPPGFAWVRMGDRYMLVSRSTGQIFDVIGR
jgi:Ni/Co efflux regulator RcnB